MTHQLPHTINLAARLELCKKVAIKAGQKIMHIYDQDFSIFTKEDESPLTQADLEANNIICDEISKQYPNEFILSEELKDNDVRLSQDLIWIVDPLDGTKEFIKKNGEFTVNIALIYKSHPIMGVVYVPVYQELYFASVGKGAYYQNIKSSINPERIAVTQNTADLKIAASKSHKSPRLEALLERNAEKISTEISKGSSLKGCLVAQGKVDVYYRFGYTMEWDTAAMHCVVEQAGGLVAQMDGSELVYNRKNCLNDKGFFMINRKENFFLEIPNPFDEVAKSPDIIWHSGKITQDQRQILLHQNPKVIWFTGLSGSGKSTLAVELEARLYDRNILSCRLDGDNVRHGLNSDLGFSIEDRDENIRRIGEVAKLFYETGLVVICSFISPSASRRDEVRRLIKEGNFIEIYVKADLDECMKRDPKGLYEKAQNGDIQNFTGISAPYDIPAHPEMIIDTTQKKVSQCVDEIMERLNF